MGGTQKCPRQLGSAMETKDAYVDMETAQQPIQPIGNILANVAYATYSDDRKDI